VNVVEALRLAFQGLLGNRLRSSLTMLGILIGVAAVIVLVSVGNGAAASVQAQINSLGSNVLYVSASNARSFGGVSQGFGTGQNLSMSDVNAIKDQSRAPDVVTAIPIVQSGGQVVYQNQNWFAPVLGTSADATGVREWSLSAGTFFTNDQVNSSSKVAVLGQTVVDNLFNGDPNAAVGQEIKIQRQSFRVVGVLASKGSTGFGNQDNLIAIPYTAAWAYLTGSQRGGGTSGGKVLSQIVVQATSQDTISKAKDEVTQIMLDSHHISDASQADFQVTSQQDLLSAANQITGILTLVLGAIAGISLVVGGIGIMNIMLVTVTERTREIGIRKAIGARWRDILLQFLIESMFLAGVGGVLGILVGTLVSRLAPRVVSALPAPVVTAPSVLLAFGVSVGIGLFFGIYPANRAARLNPIEALRYE
jgi:putative ABC transport system permease protein